LKRTCTFFFGIIAAYSVTFGYAAGSRPAVDRGSVFLYAHTLYQQRAYRRVIFFLHALYRNRLREPSLLNLKAESYLKLYSREYNPDLLRFAHNTLFVALSFGGNGRTYRNLGFYYYYKQKFHTSFDFLTKGITLQPDKDALALYIRLASRLRRLSALIRGIEMMRMLNFSQSSSLEFRLAKLYLLSGRVAKAVCIFESLSKRQIKKGMRRRIYRILLHIYSGRGKVANAARIRRLLSEKSSSPEKAVLKINNKRIY
jgi:tetratricopeptide (TPR) repeat protein